MEDLLNAATPHAMEIMGLVVTAAIGWAATAARKKWGIEIEAKHREALHSAIMTGAQMALGRKLTTVAAVDLILGYAQASVPDALKALRPDRAVLTNIARAKLREAGGDVLTKALQDVREAL